MSDLQRQLLEACVALEMAHIHHDLLRDRLAEMQYHIQQTRQRADRLEQSLRATNAALSRLSENLLTPPTISSWTEVDENGGKVLGLDNPVRKPTRPGVLRRRDPRVSLNSL